MSTYCKNILVFQPNEIDEERETEPISTTRNLGLDSENIIISLDDETDLKETCP